MKSKILIFFFLLISNLIWTQETTVLQEKLIINRSGADSTAPDLIFPLKLNAGDRYLVDQKNKPFIWIGDAGWSLFVQISTADAKLYIDNRASKGFNVILSNVLEHYFTTNPPKNYYGQSPFTGVAFQSTCNEKYFAHIDTIVRYAASKNIMMFLFPVYLGYAGGDEGFVQEINAATTTQMTTYGNYIGNRYKDFPNIVWCNGGDRNPTITPNVVAKLNAWAAGVQAYDQKHLMTAHNNSESYGIDYWNNPSWLVINNVYTRSKTIHTWYKTAYDVTPVKPFFMIEGDYEHAPTVPEWTPQEMRYPEYSAMLCGGTGYIFGNCPLFGFGFPVFGETDWKPAMDRTGSVDMGTFGKFFSSRKWNLLVPDWTHTSVTAGYGTFGNVNYAPAARASDGSSIIAYLPTSRTVTVDMTKITATDGVDCQWFNPATGVYTSIGNFPNIGVKLFTPPAAGDWVLILENSSTIPTPPVVTDTVKVLWAEPFTNWTTNSFSSPDSFSKKTEYWGYANWNQQSIVKDDAVHGNVWRAIINPYSVAPTNCWNSHSLQIPLNYRSKDLWVQREIWVPTNFNPRGVTNQDRHVPPAFKAASGFDGTDNGYFFSKPGETVDTISQAGGRQGLGHSVGTDISVGDAGNMGYFWFQGSLAAKDWQNGYCDATYGYYRINTGRWMTVTQHILDNTPGQYDGEYQEFVDGVCVVSYKGLKFRSKIQGDEWGQFEAIIFYFFVGGPQTTDYAANMQLELRTDNAQAYEYQPGSKTRGRKNIKIGDRCPVMPAPTNAVRPARLLHYELFTNKSDTVYDVGRPDINNPPNGLVTKEIKVASGNISIAFDVKNHPPQWGYPPDEPDQDYFVKVYRGTGNAKVLLYTFGRTDRGSFPGFTNPGTGMWSIGASTATIEFWIGPRGGDSRGCAVRYVTL